MVDFPHRKRLLSAPWLRVSGLVLLMLLSVSQVFAAKASVWLDPSVVGPDEPFQLTINLEGIGDGQPDLSVLKKDFQVLNQATSSSVSVINGSTSVKKTWRITLLPKRKGRLEVPVIKVADTFTNPVYVEVTNTPPATADNDKDIFLEVDVTPQDPYVSGQILVTQKVYHAVPIENARLTAPKADGDAAELVQLSQKPPYYRTISGRRYQVQERSYALFPKRSGEIEIAAARLTATVPERNPGAPGSDFGLFGMLSTGKTIRAYARPVTINVKPRAEAFTGDDWLPAKNLTFYGNWSKSLATLKAGEPVTLTLGMVADGLRAEQLPDLELKMPDGIKLYPEKVERSNNKTNSGVTAVWNQKFTVIPSGGGAFSTPEIRLPWWNVETDRQEEAVLKAEKLIVSGEPAPKQEPQTQAAPASDPEQQTTAEEESDWNGWLLLLPAMLLAGGGGYWYWRKNRETSVQKDVENADHLDAEILAELKLAANHNDPQAMQQALTRWAQHTANIRPATLTAIGEAANGYLREEIRGLSRALYSRKKRQWDARKLFRKIRRWPGATASQSTSVGHDGLQALHPVN